MTQDRLWPTFVDTHTHLDDDQFVGELEAVVERSLNAGVTRIINIGYEPARWPTTIELGRRFPSTSIALGLHPQNADQFRSSLIDELEVLTAQSGAVAIGEIGLDFFRDGPILEQQLTAFEAQLALARNLDLPVVIHQRAASEKLYHVLAAASNDTRCVLHSFEGDQQLVALGIERGFAFGVGGLMTRGNAQPLRALLSKIPLDLLMLETDSPYLVPAGLKSRRNEPANLPAIANTLATLLDLPVEHVANTTTGNAIQFFRLDQ